MMSDILTSALCEQLETVIAYFRVSHNKQPITLQNQPFTHVLLLLVNIPISSKKYTDRKLQHQFH